QDGGARAGDTEPKGLTRALGDVVEHAAHTKLLEYPRYEVELAHRDAAAQHQHVVRLEVKFQPVPELGRIVGNVVVRHTLEAMQSQGGRDGIGIRPADLVRLDGVARLDELIAGGNDGQHRLAAHPDPRHPRTGRNGDFRWTEARARSKQEIT